MRGRSKQDGAGGATLHAVEPHDHNRPVANLLAAHRLVEHRAEWIVAHHAQHGRLGRPGQGRSGPLDEHGELIEVGGLDGDFERGLGRGGPGSGRVRQDGEEGAKASPRPHPRRDHVQNPQLRLANTLRGTASAPGAGNSWCFGLSRFWPETASRSLSVTAHATRAVSSV